MANLDEMKWVWCRDSLWPSRSSKFIVLGVGILSYALYP